MENNLIKNLVFFYADNIGNNKPMPDDKIVKTNPGADLSSITAQPPTPPEPVDNIASDDEDEEFDEDDDENIDEAPPLPDQYMDDTQLAQRRVYLSEITRRKLLFPDVYADLVIESGLRYYSNEQLSAIIRDFDLAVNMRTNSRAFKWIATSGFVAIERAAPAIGYDLTGLTDITSRNEYIQDTLKELEWKYGSAKYFPPEGKLLLGLAGIIPELNKYNKEQKAKKLAGKPDEKLEKELACIINFINF